MAILDMIVQKRKERLSARKAKMPLREQKAAAAGAEPPLDFAGAIARKGGGIRLIAEVKKASPSKGLIRADFDPAKIAAIYRDRADAISVLTEEDFFQGALPYIGIVKKNSGRPVLRKDFIIDEYQVYEARAAGADAVLLIAAILETSQAREYLLMAGELGMGVLFEAHDSRDLEKALRIEAPVIGVNNRDLDTLEIDLGTTFRLKAEIPPDRLVVSESGIDTRADVLRLEEAGVDAILVGTSIMKSPDMAGKLDELMGTRNGKG
ncbi:MAG: indole-3-glycerol phosphate synthase TrpC [Nitrospiraceae bacterium]|nr:indole-3-glycerol phosphate synthase TrpC [Nitrospiraceae bacterium]